MALILNIETSTPVCSVCISKDGVVIGLREDFSGTNHAAMLAVYIQQLCEELKIELKELDAISVSSGPGSYTGLRIGVVTAKGLCYTLSKPLIALDSLEVTKEGLKAKYPEENHLYCPTIDARRDEIYFALFSQHQSILYSKNIVLTGELPFKNENEKLIVVGGSGAQKCKIKWGNKSIIYDLELLTSSGFMSQLAESKFALNQFENISSFEPDYIKPVYITSVKKDNLSY